MKRNPWQLPLIAGLTILSLYVLPLFLAVDTGTMNLLIMLCIYIVLAESWNLMGGYTGLFNLGTAAFFGCGALTSHLLWRAGLPLLPAILIGGIAAMVLALVIGIPTLRLKGFYFGIGTLALAEALRLTVGNLFPLRIVMPAEYFTNFSLIPRYYLALTLAIATVFVVYRISRSKMGLALQASREDEEAAEVSGIDVFKCKVIVFLISTFITGLAGGVFTYFRLSVTPVEQFLPNWTFEPLMAASIGGLGSISGPIWGSLLLVVIQNWLALNLGHAHYIVLGVLFILVVLSRGRFR